ncbi:caspase family protein [Bradyrhizobium sp. CIAT3101]|uniref:caspase family protein n=1 Tax=Bradyrhizobium sp. CIAT3101 TaxID=439387 RepID=UPI0024B20E1C|nr:caspase family protein [Bradyrhizobium sp. CIAT3101]WFU79276.1 caspase family protein [Bradyrhizobium sp. CIAT3101]
MMTRRGSAGVEPVGLEAPSERGFLRVTAFVVALENYRKPSNGDPLPSVDFAHADADAFADIIKRNYAGLDGDDVSVHVLKDADASLTALRDELKYTIKNLAADELFIFYYAGHGFHGAGGNRLSTYDTNRTNIEDTSLSMRDDLLEPLMDSECRQALVFVDACAEKFSGVVKSRDVISNLDASEVREFLDSAWYLGVFLSCSPGEKSYPSTTLKHGVWTHFLLEALEGRAPAALTRERWLTDFGLRDHLRQEVPRYITREMQVRGSQTPQAILSGSNSFRIHHIPKPPAVPADAALAGISLRNNSEFLEGTETGEIRCLPGFSRAKKHTVPTEASDSAEAWCQRLLSDRVAEELQELYEAARSALNARRKDVRKADDTGGGDLDTAAFRYSIETGQNPDDPAEYIIRRRLELRDGWDAHRAAIDEIFGNEFDRLVVEFERMDDTFDALVEKLEDIQESQGGEVHDDDRSERATYERDGVTFTFDLKQRRLEISFGRSGTLELVDAAQKFQFGTSRASPMLAAPTSQAVPTPVRRELRRR